VHWLGRQLDMITQTYIISRLSYDPKTGIFTWINGPRSGKRAGCLLQHGYRNININGKSYGEHRLAWLYVNGEMPTNNIDHINGVPSDNRIENLRECSQSQNKQNARPKTGYLKGAFFDKSKGKCRASIGPRGSVRYLGVFESQDQAHEAYALAAKQMYGEFARTS